MDLKTQLQKLFEKHEPDIGEYAWMYETDRWAELVFCLLNQCGRQAPETARMAVDMLQNLELIQVDKLAAIRKLNDENAVVLSYILKRYGFSEGDSQRAIRLLAHVARVIQKEYGGKIQRCLRRHGEMIRDELAGAFGSELLKEAQLRYALSHWLQNAFSLPISLEHRAVKEFCRKNRVRIQDLWRASDDLDLNISLVDDLLDMEKESGRADIPRTRVPRKK
ncbi:MAG: hypothetical protein WCC06_00775 [Candidatus Aminicenantales bacterium]